MSQVRFALAAALLLAPLSGCLEAIEDHDAFDPDAHYKNPVVAEGEYLFGNSGSKVLLAGRYQAMAPETVILQSTLPHLPIDGPLTPVNIPMAIWRPDNASGPVPVILDAGPYYEQDNTCGAEGTGECGLTDAQQRTGWLIENLLPHGYAVVQLAIRGTGSAGGCMDLLGDAETHDIVQAIDWLAAQPWSNGNVAMIGASYDGSTPWSVAATGNPHLKAIVPTASLPDIFDLMFHNGSAETRGPIMHSLVYWGFGFDDDFPQRPDELPPEAPWVGPAPVVPHTANGRSMEQDLQNLCPEVVEGSLLGPASTATGERFEEGSDYWTQRDHRQGVLDHYDGAVFLLHGLQDWNVDPHAVIPFNARLREAGIDLTEWYGQWGHQFPDGSCAQNAPEWVTLPCRLDFAQVLLDWFDRHLKGLDTPQTARVQVQDSVGFWRYMDDYPPTDAAWTEYRLGGSGILAPEVTGETRIQLDPAVGGAPRQVVELKTGFFDEDVRISGLPQLKLPFEVAGQGGELAAWLFDEDAEGKVRAINAGKPGNTWEPNTFSVPIVGHAAMNLRYHAGGEEAQVLQPGTRYVAQMEFEPLEVLVPAGHRLTMWVFQFGYPDRAATNSFGNGPGISYTQSPVTIILGPDAVLRLPIVATDYTKVFPVPGAHTPTRENLTLMHVLKPTYSASGPVAFAALPPAPATTVPAADVMAAACQRTGAC